MPPGLPPAPPVAPDGLEPVLPVVFVSPPLAVPPAPLGGDELFSPPLPPVPPFPIMSVIPDFATLDNPPLEP